MTSRLVGASTVGSFSYNAANQMSTGTGASLSATYIYGYDGMRLTKTFPGSNPVTFQNGLNGELLSENDLSGGQAADYIYLNGTPIGEIDPNAGVLYFMHTDRLGTPQRVTDGTQTVVWNAYYQPFGDNAVAGISGTLATQSLRLPGQYADPETGFNHNGFRDYYGFTTRYVESDPIGLDGGMNTYQYVDQNPVSYTDPFGLDAEFCTRPLQLPLPYARHCFLRFKQDNKDTSSYGPNGTGSDPKPTGAQCKPTQGTQNDECLKKAMSTCKSDEYDFTGHNCCHCVEDAMKACGQSIPVQDWPNWPINPGPQPGEHKRPLPPPGSKHTYSKPLQLKQR